MKQENAVLKDQVSQFKKKFLNFHPLFLLTFLDFFFHKIALYSGGASGIEQRDLYEVCLTCLILLFSHLSMFVTFMFHQALALIKRRRTARGMGGGVGDEKNIDDIDTITRPASKRLDTVVELQREVEKLRVRKFEFEFSLKIHIV